MSILYKTFMLISASFVTECTVAELACNPAVDPPYSNHMMLVFIG